MSKMKPLIATLAIAIALGSSIQAADPVKPAAKTPEAATAEAKVESQRPIPYLGKISATDKEKKTFTLQGKEKSRVFRVTPETKLAKGEAQATFDDLKAGEEVRGSARKTAEGQFDAVSVKIGPKEEGAKAETKAMPAATPAAKK